MVAHVSFSFLLTWPCDPLKKKLLLRTWIHYSTTQQYRRDRHMGRYSMGWPKNKNKNPNLAEKEKTLFPTQYHHECKIWEKKSFASILSLCMLHSTHVFIEHLNEKIQITALDSIICQTTLCFHYFIFILVTIVVDKFFQHSGPQKMLPAFQHTPVQHNEVFFPCKKIERMFVCGKQLCFAYIFIPPSRHSKFPNCS